MRVHVGRDPGEIEPHPRAAGLLTASGGVAQKSSARVPSMILETALIDIKPGLEAEFETAINQAKELVLSRAAGFEVFQLRRGIERPGTYLLTIGWRALEDHTIGFRESELFTQWRALIGPYFAQAPHVEHWI